MNAENAKRIKDILGTKTFRSTGFRASGCISEGEAYFTDSGQVFIKANKMPNAKLMFESEFTSLVALEKTLTVRVPHPIALIEGVNETYFIVLEYVNINPLDSFSAKLGEKLADLHAHNESTLKKSAEYVNKFGFPVPTCVGYLPVDNSWSDDWPSFFCARLEEQVNRLQDEEVTELWARLKLIIPRFFENVDIKPSLLHGDLWSGNVGQTTSEPIIFDPGSVYGHHELDLAMTSMFGSFGRDFYETYHKNIPKMPGFEAREQVYHLFHYLNHWNHFGSAYKSSSLSTLKKLIKKFPS